MSLTAALCMIVSKGALKQNRDLMMSVTTGFFDPRVVSVNVSAYTWIGETAAAGAVRTGIPLSGLLGEECI